MKYAVACGSNMGDRTALLAEAQAAFAAIDGVQFIAASSYLENPAIGGPAGQGDFLNGVWICEFEGDPHHLLGQLLTIEASLGRQRTVLNGPRPIDLDILMTDGGTCVDTESLTIPHPRMQERDFVLIPLAEVAAEWHHPVLKRSVAQMLADLKGTP